MSIIFGAGSGKFEAYGDEITTGWSTRPKPTRPWTKYGLTDEMYLAMVEQQGSRCAICHEEGRLNVDHDHATGKVRALLCRRCNVALGMLRDEPELAELVVEYLRKHESAGG